MTLHVRHNGSWKEVASGNNLQVRDGGSWEVVTGAYVRHGGDWKLFYVNTILTAGIGGLIFEQDAISPYNTTVGIRFNTDGTVEAATGISGAVDWTSMGVWINHSNFSSGDYSVRYTNRQVLNGVNPDFNTKSANEDTWVTLGGSVRAWTWNEGGSVIQTPSFSCDFEVRDNSGNAATGSAQYTFTIENTT